MVGNNKIRVLFVCLGNICRSPTAAGVFQRLIVERGLSDHIEVDSAGTSTWHAGEPPDARSQAEARRRGVDLAGMRSRAIVDQDFRYFDYIVAMDTANFKCLRQRSPRQYEHKLLRLTDFAPELGVDGVPDPYYGGPRGFENVYDIIEASSKGLLDYIEKEHE